MDPQKPNGAHATQPQPPGEVGRITISFDAQGNFAWKPDGQVPLQGAIVAAEAVKAVLLTRLLSGAVPAARSRLVLPDGSPAPIT